jgi:hypothetical protein
MGCHASIRIDGTWTCREYGRYVRNAEETMEDASNPRFTYRAFISYSHRDKAWADWLHKALET